MERLAHLFFRAATRLVTMQPLERNFRVGRALGILAFHLAVPYRRLAIRNLTIAFGGEKSAAEIHALAREHFATLGANLLSSFKVAAMPDAEIDARVTIENLEGMRTAFARGKGVIMVISHIGNWELFAQMAHHLPGHALSTIYQPLGNRFIDAEIRATRAKRGVQPLSRKEGFTTAIQILRENGLVGVLIDQHAGDGGIWTPLFGRLSSTSPLAATLAVRTGAVPVPVAVYTTGLARWKLVVGQPVASEGLATEVLTAELNVALERQIRVSPADWFWVHNRWKTPTPQFLLARYKRGIAYPAGFDPASLKPFSIVVRSSNWLGDAVMSVPALRAISRGRPDVRVAVLTQEKLAGFWESVREVSEVIPIAKSDSACRVAAKIRGRFDVAAVFPNSVRTALEPFLAGIPRRVGYAAKWRRRLLNQVFVQKPPANPGPKPHHALHYLNLAEWIGAAATALDFGPATPPEAGPIRLGLCAGAEYGPAKRWLPERFAEMAKQVAERRDVQWVLLGTAADAEIGEAIASGLDGRCENLIGKTTLRDLVTRLSECRLLVTNDTGTMHLSAYLRVPVVALFGSTEPALTGPMGGMHRVIRHHVECSPCFLRECPIDFRCMKEIQVDEVVEAVLRMLDS